MLHKFLKITIYWQTARASTSGITANTHTLHETHIYIKGLTKQITTKLKRVKTTNSVSQRDKSLQRTKKLVTI